MATGNGRIIPLGGREAKTDTQGRVLKHSATVQEVYEIVAAETSKVHEYYLNQIPPFVARMIQDALVSYKLVELPITDSTAPVVSETSAPDQTEPDSTPPATEALT